jgi:energy-coupling factor transporter transmembrane protein EcfT
VRIWAGRDPRAKVFLALVLSFALAAAPASRALAALPVAFLLLLTAGVGRKRLTTVLRFVLVLWGLSLAANAFLVPGHRLGPGGLGWARPTAEGLALGVSQGARLAALAALAAWAAATIRIFDLAGSLEWTVRGVPGWRRRVHRAFLPVVLALRLVPILGGEAVRILDVDRLRRGPRRGLGGLRRAAGLAPVWVVTVVERGEALALALTLRGYRPDAERGFARGYRMGPWDWSLVGAAALGAIWLGTG